MAYATQADLETRFGTDELAQLTDRVNGAVIDAAVVARAIADAEAEIDSYLAGRYSLPLASVPSVLQRLCCDIARYYLHDESVTEAVRNRYTDSVRMLKAISTGDVKIDGAAPLAAGVGVNLVEVSAPSRPRVFGGGH